MKLINLSQVGYNHPSQANWSYGIWKIDLIDTDQSYQMSYTVRENFGGDDRLKAKLSKLKIKVFIGDNSPSKHTHKQSTIFSAYKKSLNIGFLCGETN